jgi:hypothetical protein
MKKKQIGVTALQGKKIYDSYSELWGSLLVIVKIDGLGQRFSNIFQVRTTFISQNVLRTTLLLSPLKANLSFFKL